VIRYTIRDGTFDGHAKDAAATRAELAGMQREVRARVLVVPVTCGEPVPAEEWLARLDDEDAARVAPC